MRIVLADDHDQLRAALRALLESHADAEIVGEAVDGAHCLELVASTRPDLVLMDVRMPGTDGIDATAMIRERHPDVRVLALSSSDRTNDIAAMLAAGASGYLVKTSKPDEVRAALDAVTAGRPVLSPDAVARVIDDLVARHRTERHDTERREAAARMRDALLTVISDALRNPLTAVTGAASTLRHRWERLDEATRWALLGQLEAQGEVLAGRVEDVIATVSGERGDGSMDVEAVVAAAMARSRGHEGAQRLDWLPGAAPPARGDANAAAVVVAALLGRAFAAGGKVTVAAGADDAGRPTIDVAATGAEAADEDGTKDTAGIGWDGLVAVLEAGGGRLVEEVDSGGLRWRATFATA